MRNIDEGGGTHIHLQLLEGHRVWEHKQFNSLAIFFTLNFIFLSGSLESPLSASPIQSYHQSSTYFYQNCQWFFDPPPARELLMKISTTQTMGKLHHQNFNELHNSMNRNVLFASTVTNNHEVIT